MVGRKINRFPTRNYSLPGFYFVTICSRRRVCIFGQINNREMRLSGLGKIVLDCICQINAHFTGVEVSKFVVMPNHIHMILRLRWRGRIYATRTDRNRSKMLLSKVIGNFKAAVTRKAGKENIWQRSFFDRLVRNEQAYGRIENYIEMNPKIWYRDRNFIGKKGKGNF